MGGAQIHLGQDLNQSSRGCDLSALTTELSHYHYILTNASYLCFESVMISNNWNYFILF